MIYILLNTMKTFKQIILEINGTPLTESRIENELINAITDERIDALNSGRRTGDTNRIDRKSVENFARQIHNDHQQYSTESISDWNDLTQEQQGVYHEHALSSLASIAHPIRQEYSQNSIDAGDNLVSQEGFDAAHDAYKKATQHIPLVGLEPIEGIDLFHRKIILDAHRYYTGSGRLKRRGDPD